MVKTSKTARIQFILGFVSVLKGIDDIEERNRVFNSLTKEEMRREIAYDCIQVLATNRVKASDGYYWSPSLTDIHYKKASTFQNRLIKHIPKCEVCQRGLIMVSTIRLGNQISTTDVFKHAGCDENLKGFSIVDMRTMEEEYEHDMYGHPYESNTQEKLVNTCYNVLLNGNFRIDDDTDYLTLLEVKPKDYGNT